MAEHGFFHPERGYWQAIDGDPEQLLSSYPEGTQSVPLKPGTDYEWRNGEWGATPALPFVVVLHPVDLWSRLTEAEAEQVEAVMATQPVRIQNIFKAASSYRSDHELWPLLEGVAVGLFGPDRAKEILAAS